MTLLVGTPRRKAEARKIDLDRIISLAHRHAAWRQKALIEEDLSRTPYSAEDYGATCRATRAAVQVSLNSKVGYTQGMHMVAGVLFRAYAAGGAEFPLHDALASLSAAARINAAYAPLHPADGVPIVQSQIVAVQMCVDVSNHAPEMRAVAKTLLPWLQMFVLQTFPVLFANAIPREDALRHWWDFIFEREDARQTRAVTLRWRCYCRTAGCLSLGRASTSRTRFFSLCWS